MPNISVWFGRLLIVVGLIGYGYGIYNGNSSPTAMIPALFGAFLMILGHFAEFKESLRKHLMHAAVMIGLIGFLLTAGRLLMKFNDLSLSAAVISQAAMGVICLVYVILAVRSFIDARKKM